MHHAFLRIVLLSQFSVASPPNEVLPRRAWIDAGLAPLSDGGAIVTRIDSGSVIGSAGLRIGDTVTAIGEARIRGAAELSEALRGLRAGIPSVFIVRRGGMQRRVSVMLRSLPSEMMEGRAVSYESVSLSPGLRVRMIVSRPDSVRGKLPALLWVPWLDCSSVEIPVGRRHGAAELARRLSMLSGFAVVRFDKPGAGDSEGSCRELDLEGELAAARAVLAAVRGRSDVDPERIFLIGPSFSGGLLPLIASERIAGYVIINSWYRTWYERLIEFERRQRELAGKSSADITREVRLLAELYSEYLNREKTPARVIAERPHLASVWADEPAHQYGRPAQFFHQLQAVNIAREWEQVTAPVLAVYGEFDWVMSRRDHELLVGDVNRRRPGSASLLIIPRMNHSLFVYDDISVAYRDFWAGKFPENLLSEISAWLQREVRSER